MNISKYDFVDILQFYESISERLEAFVINLSIKGHIDTEVIDRVNTMRNLVLKKKQFLAERYFDEYKKSHGTSLTLQLNNKVR